MAEDQPKKRVLKQDSIKGRADKARVNSSNKPKRVSGLLSKIFAPLGFITKPLRSVGKKIVPRYIKNSFAELRLVTWPKRRETRKLTTAVILFALILGASVSLVDIGLDKVFKKVILKQ